ncbi:MAG: GDP-L-fucose synthase [Xanthobacteraceae bacterium]
MSAETKNFDLAGKCVFVAGHAGMVGSAILRRLAAEDCEVVVVPRRDCDLRQSENVDRFLAGARPDAIFLAAGTVGGIQANSTFPADFIADNLAIALNVIRGAYHTGVRKLLYLGSSCTYPRLAPQPMTPDMLLGGPLEPTNQWYAVAKIAGIKLCEAYRIQHDADFISLMPASLYGPGDNYDLENSHVPAALLRRFHEAKVSNTPRVIVWGTGTPRRELMAVDDLADACVFAMKSYSDVEFLNVGTGEDMTIGELARFIAEVVGYQGEIAFDPSKPDGMPRKLLDVSRINELGWRATISLGEGLHRMYADFLKRFGAKFSDIKLARVT